MRTPNSIAPWVCPHERTGEEKRGKGLGRMRRRGPGQLAPEHAEPQLQLYVLTQKIFQFIHFEEKKKKNGPGVFGNFPAK
jgi:hypothetical protein